jgi:hypothetical protein
VLTAAEYPDAGSARADERSREDPWSG